MPEVKVGDARLYYEVRGGGEPLVLIPGYGMGGRMWFRQTEALARHFRTVVFDPRGVGRSGWADGFITSAATLAADVAGLLRGLGVERAHVLGASFGGFVAQEFALAYPEMTGCLILCCTSAGGARHLAPAESVARALSSPGGLNTAERARKSLLLSFSTRFLEERAEVVEEFISLRLASHVSDEVFLGQLRAAVSFDAGERVRGITAPTLVITGDADAVVPADNSRRLAAAIPGAELEVMGGGSHLFFVEQAEEFNRAVAEFIGKNGGAILKS